MRCVVDLIIKSDQLFRGLIGDTQAYVTLFEMRNHTAVYVRMQYYRWVWSGLEIHLKKHSFSAFKIKKIIFLMFFNQVSIFKRKFLYARQWLWIYKKDQYFSSRSNFMLWECFRIRLCEWRRHVVNCEYVLWKFNDKMFDKISEN